jgi:hypothetical protein
MRSLNAFSRLYVCHSDINIDIQLSQLTWQKQDIDALAKIVSSFAPDGK